MRAATEQLFSPFQLTHDAFDARVWEQSAWGWTGTPTCLASAVQSATAKLSTAPALQDLLLSW